MQAVPLAAAGAGGALSFILGPTELIKCRMQSGDVEGRVRPRTALECVRGIVAREGLPGLARGLGATMAREVPGNAIYFTTYVALKETVRWAWEWSHGNRTSCGTGRELVSSRRQDGSVEAETGAAMSSGQTGNETRNTAEPSRAPSESSQTPVWSASPASGYLAMDPFTPSVPALDAAIDPPPLLEPADGPPPLPPLLAAGSAVLCGGLAGVTMWTLVLPLDAAKTRVQVAERGSSRDVGFVASLRELRRTGQLFAGLRPTLLRAFPANAAQWGAYELAQWLGAKLLEN